MFKRLFSMMTRVVKKTPVFTGKLAIDLADEVLYDLLKGVMKQFGKDVDVSKDPTSGRTRIHENDRLTKLSVVILELTESSPAEVVTLFRRVREADGRTAPIRDEDDVSRALAKLIPIHLKGRGWIEVGKQNVLRALKLEDDDFWTLIEMLERDTFAENVEEAFDRIRTRVRKSIRKTGDPRGASIPTLFELRVAEILEPMQVGAAKFAANARAAREAELAKGRFGKLGRVFTG